MSENSNSTNGNSWTVLTPEVKETGVENVGPAAEGLKLSKAPEPSQAHNDLKKHSSEASAHQPETQTSTQCPSDTALTHESETARDTQVTCPETSEGRSQLNAARVEEETTSDRVEDISSNKQQHDLTGHSESPVCPATDVDSFSDSYTHISLTSGSSSIPASACQEKDWFKSDESLRKTEESKEALETNGKEGDGLRKRKISHLGSLDKTEAEEDEEGEEEDFQPPQREEETVFTLNKCILAAVILLGLGTIFFSEADMDVRDLRDPTNQEWLKSDVSRETPVDLQPPDMLSKQTKEDQQILILQEKIQQHQGELRAAQLLAEAGEKERARREELEKEYERMKGELDKVPALQKELEHENERMKEESERAKKELEALPSLQRELEHLREKVSQLTQSTGKADSLHPVADSRVPSSGYKREVPPAGRQDLKTWDKKREEKEQSKGDKEWKKKKSEKKEDDKEKREKVREGERTKDQKDWKKEDKTGRQKEEKKEWKKDKKRNDDKKENEDTKEWDDKKERKEDKKWKKDKHVRQDERRDDRKDSGNKKEKKEWKRKEENKDWRSDKKKDRNDHKDWKEKKKDEKEFRKEGKHNEKKLKEFPKEYERKEKEEKHSRGKQRESKDGEWTREEKKNKAQYHKNEGRKTHDEKEKQHKERHGKETSSRHHSHHQNYWRERIQHTDGRRDACEGVEDCARAEGLAPVRLQDFQILLQSYLNKLQDPEEQSRKEQLRQLVEEFFTGGVFAHHQMPFRDFVEDVGDILEDMAEGDESDSDAEDSEEEEEEDDDDDDEMEDFEREAMEKFALPEEVRKTERKAEQRKESGRVRG